MDFEIEEEDEFEREIEEGGQLRDNTYVSSNLLMLVQGLGEVRMLKGEEVYVPSDCCEESLREIIKEIKNDPDDHPFVRLLLAEWQVLNKDLLPLLITQTQDKKLQFYLVIALVLLTDKFNGGQDNKDNMLKGLFETNALKMSSISETYKQQIVSQKECLKTLVNHLGDIIQTTRKTKFHDQMVELIITFFRNLIVSGAYEGCYRRYQQGSIAQDLCADNLERQLLIELKEQGVLDAMIYLAQDMRQDRVLAGLDLVFMEAFFAIFTQVDLDALYTDKNNHLLQKIKEQDRKERLSRLSGHSSRHSRFDTNIKVKRQFESTYKVISNVKQLDNKNQQLMNTYEGQQNKPKGREKMKRMETDRVFYDLGDKQFKSMVDALVMDFMGNIFNVLMESASNRLTIDSGDSITDSDRVMFMYLYTFGLKCNRLASHQKAQEIQIQNIINTLQLSMFTQLYQQMNLQTLRKKGDFSLRVFVHSLSAFLELLKTVKLLATSSIEMNRQNSQVLMQTIFIHDITRLFKYIYAFIPHQNPKYSLFLDNILVLVGLFYDLLDNFSRGKFMKIQTNKLVTKKEKGKKEKRNDDQEEMGDFIEKDQQDDDDNDDYAPNKENKQKEDMAKEKGDSQSNSASDEEEEENTHEYQERRFTLQSEFALLADYDVVDKVMHQLSRMLINSEEVNTGVLKFIRRIIDLVDASWLFYQTDYMEVFNNILSDQQVAGLAFHKLQGSQQQLVKLIRRLVKGFFMLMKQNKMLIVESLFRLQDRSIKDQVINNYSFELQNQNQQQEEQIDNDENNQQLSLFLVDVKGQHQQSNNWTFNQDVQLMNIFKQMKQTQYNNQSLLFAIQLYFIHNNQGYKNIINIQKRINKLKLYKFEYEYSFKRIKKIHDEKQNHDIVSTKSIAKQLDSDINKKEFTQEQLNQFIQDIFNNFNDMRGQGNESQLGEMVVVIIDTLQNKLIKQKSVSDLLKFIGLQEPNFITHFWRIPFHLTMKTIANRHESVVNQMKTNQQNQQSQQVKEINEETQEVGNQQENMF